MDVKAPPRRRLAGFLLRNRAADAAKCQAPAEAGAIVLFFVKSRDPIGVRHLQGLNDKLSFQNFRLLVTRIKAGIGR